MMFYHTFNFFVLCIYVSGNKLATGCGTCVSYTQVSYSDIILMSIIFPPTVNLVCWLWHGKQYVDFSG